MAGISFPGGAHRCRPNGRNRGPPLLFFVVIGRIDHDAGGRDDSAIGGSGM